MTNNIFENQTLKNIIKGSNKIINFVPTMGNLHLGHESLIKMAIKESQICIVSIFVNPLQFSEKKDFESYPKTYDDDIRKINNLGVDYVFLPDPSFINDIKNITSLDLGVITKVMCGKDRPGHFNGVAKIVSKFLKLIKPNFIYLGEKDYQQIVVIKKLIIKLSLKTKVKTHQIVREKNGLAFSSRNSKIGHKNKKLAAEIFKTLTTIKNEITKDFFLISRLNYFKELLKSSGFEKINYFEIRKVNTLLPVDKEYSLCRLFISAQIQGIRLIDNIFVGKIKMENQRIISS